MMKKKINSIRYDFFFLTFLILSLLFFNNCCSAGILDKKVSPEALALVRLHIINSAEIPSVKEKFFPSLETLMRLDGLKEGMSWEKLITENQELLVYRSKVESILPKIEESLEFYTTKGLCQVVYDHCPGADILESLVRLGLFKGTFIEALIIAGGGDGIEGFLNDSKPRKEKMAGICWLNLCRALCVLSNNIKPGTYYAPRSEKNEIHLLSQIYSEIIDWSEKYKLGHTAIIASRSSVIARDHEQLRMLWMLKYNKKFKNVHLSNEQTHAIQLLAACISDSGENIASHLAATIKSDLDWFADPVCRSVTFDEDESVNYECNWTVIKCACELIAIGKSYLDKEKIGSKEIQLLDKKHFVSDAETTRKEDESTEGVVKFPMSGYLSESEILLIDSLPEFKRKEFLWGMIHKEFEPSYETIPTHIAIPAHIAIPCSFKKDFIRTELSRCSRAQILSEFERLDDTLFKELTAALVHHWKSAVRSFVGNRDLSRNLSFHDLFTLLNKTDAFKKYPVLFDQLFPRTDNVKHEKISLPFAFAGWWLFSCQKKCTWKQLYGFVDTAVHVNGALFFMQTFVRYFDSLQAGNGLRVSVLSDDVSVKINLKRDDDFGLPSGTLNQLVTEWRSGGYNRNEILEVAGFLSSQLHDFLAPLIPEKTGVICLTEEEDADVNLCRETAGTQPDIMTTSAVMYPLTLKSVNSVKTVEPQSTTRQRGFDQPVDNAGLCMLVKNLPICRSSDFADKLFAKIDCGIWEQMNLAGTTDARIINALAVWCNNKKTWRDVFDLLRTCVPEKQQALEDYKLCFQVPEVYQRWLLELPLFFHVRDVPESAVTSESISDLPMLQHMLAYEQKVYGVRFWSAAHSKASLSYLQSLYISPALWFAARWRAGDKFVLSDHFGIGIPEQGKDEQYIVVPVRPLNRSEILGLAFNISKEMAPLCSIIGEELALSGFSKTGKMGKKSGPAEPVTACGKCYELLDLWHKHTIDRSLFWLDARLSAIGKNKAGKTNRLRQKIFDVMAGCKPFDKAVTMTSYRNSILFHEHNFQEIALRVADILKSGDHAGVCEVISHVTWRELMFCPCWSELQRSALNSLYCEYYPANPM